MKINFTHLAFIVFSFLVSIYLLILVSCSPNYHMRKFINKGGVIKNDTTIVTLTDTIKGKDGKDSIIYRPISVQCPELVAPPTRFEIRYKYKTIRDSFETVKYITKFKYKEAVKTLKNEKKSSWGFNLRFIGIIAFLLFLIVVLFKLNKIWK
jgi:hypothetical protein